MKNYNFLVIAMAIFIAFTSCSNDSAEIHLSNYELVFDYEGKLTNNVVTVSNDGENWSALAADSWVKISTDKNSGTITVNVDGAYKKPAGRTSAVRVWSSKDPDAYKTIVVRQTGPDIKVEDLLGEWDVTQIIWPSDLTQKQHRLTVNKATGSEQFRITNLLGETNRANEIMVNFDLHNMILEIPYPQILEPSWTPGTKTYIAPHSFRYASDHMNPGTAKMEIEVENGKMSIMIYNNVRFTINFSENSQTFNSSFILIEEEENSDLYETYYLDTIWTKSLR